MSDRIHFVDPFITLAIVSSTNSTLSVILIGQGFVRVRQTALQPKCRLLKCNKGYNSRGNASVLHSNRLPVFLSLFHTMHFYLFRILLERLMVSFVCASAKNLKKKSKTKKNYK